MPELELRQRAANPGLRSTVRDYWGYAEETAGPLRRRELPSADIIVIINLGAPLRVTQPQSGVHVVPTGGGFVAGLHETYALTETAGSQTGIELRLSPLGAYRLLRAPMDAVANRTVALDELLGPWAIDVAARVQDAVTWESQFTVLDRALAKRLEDAPRPAPEVAWAWRQMVLAGGRVAIAPLAAELGWSPKRLIARFREQIGLPPKQAARLLRFGRATSLLLAAETPDWGALAQTCGYCRSVPPDPRVPALRRRHPARVGATAAGGRWRVRRRLTECLGKDHRWTISSASPAARSTRRRPSRRRAARSARTSGSTSATTGSGGRRWPSCGGGPPQPVRGGRAGADRDRHRADASPSGSRPT